MPLNDLLIPDIGFMTAEVESTYGTDPATSPKHLILRDPPDADAMREQIERSRVKPSAGGDENDVHKIKAEFSFQTTIAPLPANDGAVPSTRPIWIASGHEETLTSNSSSAPFEAAYKPLPRNYGSATFKFYIPTEKSETDYTKLVITGARCIPTLDYSSGSELLLDVEGEGLYAEWTQIQDFSTEEPTTLAQGQTPFTTPNQSFQFGGAVNSDVSGLDFSPSRSFNDVGSATAEEMAKEILLRPGDGKHSGSFDPLATTVGQTDDPRDLARRAGTVDMALDVTNPGGSREFHLFAPKAEVTEAPMESGDGHFRYGTTYQLNETNVGADDDYEIRWVAN